MTTEILQGQTLPDIAIQENGTLETLFGWATLNNRSITANLVAGSWLEIYDDEDSDDKKVLRLYARKNVHPATGGTDGLQGIGYWSIGQNLIVG